MTTNYPVTLEARLDQPSRGLWLLKWLLLIPHIFVLIFLWLAFIVLTVIVFFAILFTARYPRSLFDFNLGVLRWTWRVNYYGYQALGTDRYPPFTLRDVPDYPARLHIEYPEQLNRWLPLVKWLLAIPHGIILGALLGGWTAYDTNGNESTGGWSVLAALVFVAAVGLLFTGRYPGGLYNFVLGIDRWAVRVGAYVALMTDAYPPFRLDPGGEEPGRPGPLLGAEGNPD